MDDTDPKWERSKYVVMLGAPLDEESQRLLARIVDLCKEDDVDVVVLHDTLSAFAERERRRSPAELRRAHGQIVAAQRVDIGPRPRTDRLSRRKQKSLDSKKTYGPPRHKKW